MLYVHVSTTKLSVSAQMVLLEIQHQTKVVYEFLKNAPKQINVPQLTCVSLTCVVYLAQIPLRVQWERDVMIMSASKFVTGIVIAYLERYVLKEYVSRDVLQTQIVSNTKYVRRKHANVPQVIYRALMNASISTNATNIHVIQQQNVSIYQARIDVFVQKELQEIRSSALVAGSPISAIEIQIALLIWLAYMGTAKILVLA